MMLEPKQSADMGRLIETLSKFPDGELSIQHNPSSPVAWTAYLVDMENLFSPDSTNYAATGETFAEALAKLSKLVYEEQLKTKG